MDPVLETAEEKLEREKRFDDKFDEWKKNPPPPEELDRRVASTSQARRVQDQADERVIKIQLERLTTKK